MEASLDAKGLEPGTAPAGEEWMVLGVVFRALRHLRLSLLEIESRGRPRVPGGIYRDPSGRAVARVFPRTVGERLLFRGVRADVRAPASTSPAALRGGQARPYRDLDGAPSPLCLVLGAGNAGSLPVTDSLTRLVVENRVVLLKMSPLNDYLGPLLEDAFRPLVERGALRVVYGDARVGERLSLHPEVDEIHLTGSARTYEAVVFGSDPSGRRRKEEGRPRLDKRVTAELGNVTPVVVVPGPWSEEDHRYHADQLASWLVTNAGFNCVTPRVLVQQRAWPGRVRLLDHLEGALGRIETRPAYYPGSEERHRKFTRGRPEAIQVGSTAGTRLPWTVVPDLDPEDDAGDPCFREEAFCGLMCETSLEAPDPSTFLDRAVRFVNERLWGTLTATVLVHPASLEEPGMARAVERAVEELEYGTVGLNARGEYGYLLMTTAWGGYPGSDSTDIQSGVGRMGNALMLPGVEKNVIRAPFRRRKDPFLASSGVLAEFGRRYCRWEARPGLPRALSLAGTALRA